MKTHNILFWAMVLANVSISPTHAQTPSARPGGGQPSAPASGPSESLNQDGLKAAFGGIASTAQSLAPVMAPTPGVTPSTTTIDPSGRSRPGFLGKETAWVGAGTMFTAYLNYKMSQAGMSPGSIAVANTFMAAALASPAGHAHAVVVGGAAITNIAASDFIERQLPDDNLGSVIAKGVLNGAASGAIAVGTVKAIAVLTGAATLPSLGVIAGFAGVTGGVIYVAGKAYEVASPGPETPEFPASGLGKSQSGGSAAPLQLLEPITVGLPGSGNGPAAGSQPGLSAPAAPASGSGDVAVLPPAILPGFPKNDQEAIQEVLNERKGVPFGIPGYTADPPAPVPIPDRRVSGGVAASPPTPLPPAAIPGPTGAGEPDRQPLPGAPPVRSPPPSNQARIPTPAGPAPIPGPLLPAPFPTPRIQGGQLPTPLPVPGVQPRAPAVSPAGRQPAPAATPSPARAAGNCFSYCVGNYTRHLPHALPCTFVDRKATGSDALCKQLSEASVARVNAGERPGNAQTGARPAQSHPQPAPQASTPANSGAAAATHEARRRAEAERHAQQRALEEQRARQRAAAEQQNRQAQQQAAARQAEQARQRAAAEHRRREAQQHENAARQRAQAQQRATAAQAQQRAQAHQRAVAAQQQARQRAIAAQQQAQHRALAQQRAIAAQQAYQRQLAAQQARNRAAAAPRPRFQPVTCATCRRR